MTNAPLSDEQFKELLRVVRETIRSEMRDEFSGRKAMAARGLAPEDRRALEISHFQVPTHVAGTPV